MKKKILFITGTRADYGKMKPLMKAVDKHESFEIFVFVCGMHLQEFFGSTYREVLKDKYDNTYVAHGLLQTSNTCINLGNTISTLSSYVENIKPDIIIVHGDRIEALAGAVVGALNNIIVGHIEGGEISGTIDESIRHAISKFAHVHFVCTKEARRRLIQLGEEENRIFIIGSPDIDIMLSDKLPSIKEAKKRYEIEFEKYAILMYHPVTTEYRIIGENVKQVVNAVLESGKSYIVIYPNNDLGSEVILNEYRRFEGNSNFKLFPSLRFEYFLTLLKYTDFIIGNSSAGIREAGVYGIPAIDIGSRQSNRYYNLDVKHIQHVNENMNEIIDSIGKIEKYRLSSLIFGNGNSTENFLKIISEENFWNIQIQKEFIDYDKINSKKMKLEF